MQYFCREQLKPFGKMKIFFIILSIFLFMFGLYVEAISIFIIVILAHFYKSNDGKGGKSSGYGYD